jgi:hypothetical protein
MRQRRRLGDEQILALWKCQRGMSDSYDDRNFTAPLLGAIAASTLIVYGDRDFLYPLEMAIAMYRASLALRCGWCRTAVTGRCWRRPRPNSRKPRCAFLGS